MNADEHRLKSRKKSVFICVYLWLVAFVLFSVGCSQFEPPKSEPFYAETAPPQRKEFRWSNGKTPKSFDPARASAAPETDVIRAIYEGLTDTDPKTLQTVPAIAAEWKSSEDFKTWTFVLRRDARWSNGERITAKDFAGSWKRLATMGDKITHRELLQNIVGLKSAMSETPAPLPNDTEDAAIFPAETFNPTDALPSDQPNSNVNAAAPQVAASPTAADAVTKGMPTAEKSFESAFGVRAINNFTLEVSLVNPDKDFPALVAHPIFRPIYGDGKNFETNKLNADIVTSGAFRVSSVGQDGITLDRAEKYWNREAIELERVRFVPTENAEKALAAYRNGEIDAVTNADFAPLALKLLTPFEDFRRTTHSAINFYEFNRQKPPFNDRRVREALAIAVERERLTEDEMGGASLPALNFLPIEKAGAAKFVQDAARAKTLLTESGFPNGENFPVVKLLINRNNLQQRIARATAKMWKRTLNIATEIVVRDAKEIDEAWATGEFALLRRGVVLPTSNETINLLAIFDRQIVADIENSQPPADNLQTGTSLNSDSFPASAPPETKATVEKDFASVAPVEEIETILTEEQAIKQLPAIPLYFPTSFSLVKPYIQGFDTNVLDAPSLKTVRIDNDWQPKTAKNES